MQDYRTNNFKHSIGLYNKVTYPALEGKPGNSSKKSASSAPEESKPKDLGFKMLRTLEISVIISFRQDCNTVGHH